MTDQQPSHSLEEVTRLGDETLELYEDLYGALENRGLARQLEQSIEAQRRALQALSQNQRARGELPQAGDPERAGLRALAARVRAGLSSGPHDEAIDSTLLEAARELHRQIDCALEGADPDTATRLESYREQVEKSEALLREAL